MPADLWASLEAIDGPNIARVAQKPVNSFTVVEYAKKFGLSESYASKLVAQLFKSGKVKRFKLGRMSYYTLA